MFVRETFPVFSTVMVYTTRSPKVILVGSDCVTVTVFVTLSFPSFTSFTSVGSLIVFPSKSFPSSLTSVTWVCDGVISLAETVTWFLTKLGATAAASAVKVAVQVATSPAKRVDELDPAVALTKVGKRQEKWRHYFHVLNYQL